MSDSPRQKIQGNAAVTNASASAVLLAAQGGEKKIRLHKVNIGITLAATGGSGVVSIKDGTTVIVSLEADTAGNFIIDFGDHPDKGWDLAANAALNLVTEGAVTTQASANAAAIATVLI